MSELEGLKIVVASVLGVIIIGLLLFLKKLQRKKIERLLEEVEKETTLRVEWESKQYIEEQMYIEYFQKGTQDYEKEEIQIWTEVSLKKTGKNSFYDIFAVDNDSVCFVIGEIEGRGIEILLQLVAIRSMIKSQMQEKKLTKAVMEIINKQWIAWNNKNEIRILLLIYNKNTNCIMYCNAGYTLPILKKTNNVFLTIDMEIGKPVGRNQVENYWQEYQYLRQGDSVLLYSRQVGEVLTKGQDGEGVEETLRETLEYENFKAPIANMGMVIKGLLEESNVTDENIIVISFTSNQD